LDYSREPTYSALAYNIKNEKVIFSASGTNKSYFWIIDFKNKDEKGNPTFEFYNCFDDFLNKS